MARLSQGQMIAAVGAVALLIAMFLPWIGVSGPSLPSGVPGGVDTSSSEDIWKGSSLDIYLLITAVVALLPALMALTDSAEEFSFVSAATFLLGVVAVILVIAFLTVDFPDGADRKVGAFIGLGAALVIAFGGFRAMQEEVAAEI
jgi:uncharacterized membrane protein